MFRDRTRVAKPLVWLGERVKSPPLTVAGRQKCGALLRLLQLGASLGMPASRPMPSIAPRCHELRVTDGGVDWRLVYRIDGDAIVIVSAFRKTTQQTPQRIVRQCRDRLRRYDNRGQNG
jgi:phage-related protein